jgi:choline dehydrogenase-like flavoprotein
VSHQYQVAVVGSGSAGKDAARAGLRTVVIEAGSLGGTGLHRGCDAVRALADRSGVGLAALFKVRHVALSLTEEALERGNLRPDTLGPYRRPLPTPPNHEYRGRSQINERAAAWRGQAKGALWSEGSSPRVWKAKIPSAAPASDHRTYRGPSRIRCPRLTVLRFCESPLFGAPTNAHRAEPRPV